MAPLHIGVLVVPPIQLLDIAPIDLFAMRTQTYLNECGLPPALVALAPPDIKITYICASGPATPVPTTASLCLAMNADLEDPSVAPGSLDILLIPGPPPGMPVEEPVREFVRRHVGRGVDLLTICTGAFVAAQSGVLDAKRATGSRGVLDRLEKAHPAVKWEDRRYVNDGKIWTAGGITNGMDMVATYMRRRWPGAATETVIEMADVQVRPPEYESGRVANGAWWVFHIFKAWVAGLTGLQKVHPRSS